MPTPAPVAARGRGLARFTLLAAVGCALSAGFACYRAWDAVDVLSAHPVAGPLTWIVVLAVALLAALVVVLVALVALLRCRPRRVAALALACSLVLPVVSVWVSFQLGLDAARRHAETALAADGGVADRGAALLAQWGVEAGPGRDLLKAVLRADAGR